MSSLSVQLRTLLSQLRAEQPWVDATLAELEADAGQAALAADLRCALSDSAQAYSASRACLVSLWRSAESGAGWTSTASREAFVLACLAACATGTEEGVGGLNAAARMRHLDEAFIMGAPQELCQPFVEAVEPHVILATAPSATPTCFAACVPAASENAAQLPRLQRPSAQEFKAFYQQDAPVLLTESDAASWPALSKWASPRFWVSQHGHRCVPLEDGSPGSASWHERIATVADFVHCLLDGRNVVYVAQHTLFDHLPSLRTDFSPPSFLGNRVTRTNAWFGSASTVTPLHYDSYDGLLVQVLGHKLVRLYSPEATPLLYPCRSEWSAQRWWPTADEIAAQSSRDDAQGKGTVSLVDIEAPDLERFPLFAQATDFEVVLSPGDALFIPAGWWHHVRALSVSFSISFVL